MDIMILLDITELEIENYGCDSRKPPGWIADCVIFSSKIFYAFIQ